MKQKTTADSDNNEDAYDIHIQFISITMMPKLITANLLLEQMSAMWQCCAICKAQKMCPRIAITLHFTQCGMKDSIQIVKDDISTRS